MALVVGTVDPVGRRARDDALMACLPAGSVLADDGDVQVVVATPEFEVGSLIELHGTTDHPGLLVTLDPG